jgi:hypothetical protein
MAEARGFGSDVKLQVLAKLMLAERFIPRLFEQIAMAAAVDPNGQCASLAQLEGSAGKTAASVTAPKKGQKKDGEDDGAAANSENATLAEWQSSHQIMAWAKVQPAIAGEDLRPYLFVAKDRKDFFGAGIALGHLAPLVEKLLGAKLAVQRLEPELRQIAPSEAAQIFEAIRSRIAGSDVLDTQPPGIDGLVALVRAHPALQHGLVDLLDALPPNRCGTWAVSGWEGVLVEPAAILRFEQLLQRWSTTSNPTLKVAAAGALRLRSGARR